MPFERLLLLWDEFDDLVGAFRHQFLNLAHGLAGLGQRVASRLPAAAALTDARSES